MSSMSKFWPGRRAHRPRGDHQLHGRPGTVDHVHLDAAEPRNLRRLLHAPGHSTSGQPVTFSIDSASTNGARSIDGSGTVSFTGVGTCVIDASQAGGNGYAAVMHGSMRESKSSFGSPTTSMTLPQDGCAGQKDSEYSHVAGLSTKVGQMNVPTASADRYASTEYAATYLRAEWADVLFPGEFEVSSELDSATPDKLGGDGCPGRFYRRLGLIMSSWAADLDLKPDRICDVGGGTGRMAFEMATHFPQASEIVFVEPSYSFCEWARRLLAGAEFDGCIPLPDKLTRPTYRFVVEGSLPKPVPQVQICNATAHVVPRPLAYFDLVSCLNVVDRVDDPARLVADLTGLLRPGGLLVLASPLHFEEQFTSRSRWLGDLRELLDPAYWDVGLREVDVRYEFLYYRRRMSLYLSQVVGAVLMDK